MPERIYRDPVHNNIRLQTDSDEGDLMMRLIDAAEFQRLRRIKQLGLGLYTYQGAEHSRFTHSLGAFHLMTRVLDRLGERYVIKAADRIAARAAALLHDVGHGSFSHVMEKVLNFHHERWTMDVILSESSEIGELLRSHSDDLPAKVASIETGIAYTTLRDLAFRGEIQVVRVGRARYFERRDLDQWIASHKERLAL